MRDKKPKAVASLNPSSSAPTMTPVPATTGTGSNTVDAKEPNMGGLAEGHCRKEAWTGGKPNPAWSGPGNTHAIDFPLPTQMQKPPQVN